MTTKDLYYQYPNIFGEHDSDVIKEVMQWAYNLALDYASENVVSKVEENKECEVKYLGTFCITPDKESILNLKIIE